MQETSFPLCLKKQNGHDPLLRPISILAVWEARERIVLVAEVPAATHYSRAVASHSFSHTRIYSKVPYSKKSPRLIYYSFLIFAILENHGKRSP